MVDSKTSACHLMWSFEFNPCNCAQEIAVIIKYKFLILKSVSSIVCTKSCGYVFTIIDVDKEI